MPLSFARRRAAALLFAFALGFSAFHPPAARAEPRALTLAVYDLAPYGAVEHDGAFNGASVDLWRRVAELCDYRYNFVAVAKMDTILAGLRARQYDVAIGAITITPERAVQVDFSYPAHRSGVAVATQRPSGVLDALTSYFAAATDLGGLLVSVAAAMALVGVLMWLVERPRRRTEPGGEGSSVVSLHDGVYWAVVTMTTVGYGDKTPKTPAGRAVAILWMLSSIALVSILTSSLISRLTAAQLEDGGRLRVTDMRGKRLAAANYSSGAEYLGTQGLAFAKYDSLAAALDALDRKQADAVVNSVGALRQMVSTRFSATLTVKRDLLAPAYMAFAFPAGSELKKPVDRALMRITATPEWSAVEESYFAR